MKYRLLVISRIETDLGNEMVVATFYPASQAVIKPRPYEKLRAAYFHAFDPAVELAEAVSVKGKHRLKILMKRPADDEDERRALGAAYYARIFGRPCGNDEGQKGIADALYQIMRDLHRAPADTEEAWTAACVPAVDALFRLAARASGA